LADTVAFGNGSTANALFVNADSSILVAGNQGGSNPPFVVRYDHTGGLDGGFARFKTSGKGTLTGLTVLSTGALFASGTDQTASPAVLAVRLQPDRPAPRGGGG